MGVQRRIMKGPSAPPYVPRWGYGAAQPPHIPTKNIQNQANAVSIVDARFHPRVRIMKIAYGVARAIDDIQFATVVIGERAL